MNQGRRIGRHIFLWLVVTHGVKAAQTNYATVGMRFNPIATEKDILDDLRGNPALINVPNGDGFTCLMLASQLGDLEKVKLFISLGADVNVKTLIPDQDGYVENSALHIAMIAGNNNSNDITVAATLASEEPPPKGIIGLLIDHGADVNAKNKNILPPDPSMQLIKGGQTPVHLLMWVQDRDKRMRILHYLTAHGANINAQDAGGNTMLHWAVGNNDIDWVTRVNDEYGPEVSFTIRNRFGMTPQEYANASGYGQMSDLLLLLQKRRGDDGDVTSRDEQGKTPLMVAVEARDIPAIKRLLALDADVNTMDYSGNTSLHYAVQAGDKAVEIITLLASKPLMISPMNLHGITPLELVLDLPPDKAVPVAQVLIENGASLFEGSGGKTIFGLAIEKNNVPLVSYFKTVLEGMIKNPNIQAALDAIKKSNLIVETVTHAAAANQQAPDVTSGLSTVEPGAVTPAAQLPQPPAGSGLNQTLNSGQSVAGTPATPSTQPPA